MASVDLAAIENDYMQVENMYRSFEQSLKSSGLNNMIAEAYNRARSIRSIQTVNNITVAEQQFRLETFQLVQNTLNMLGNSTTRNMNTVLGVLKHMKDRLEKQCAMVRRTNRPAPLVMRNLLQVVNQYLREYLSVESRLQTIKSKAKPSELSRVAHM